MVTNIHQAPNPKSPSHSTVSPPLYIPSQIDIRNLTLDSRVSVEPHYDDHLNHYQNKRVHHSEQQMRARVVEKQDLLELTVENRVVHDPNHIRYYEHCEHSEHTVHDLPLQQILFVERQQEDEQADIVLRFDEIVDQAENQTQVREHVDQPDVLLRNHAFTKRLPPPFSQSSAIAEFKCTSIIL